MLSRPQESGAGGCQPPSRFPIVIIPIGRGDSWHFGAMFLLQKSFRILMQGAPRCLERKRMKRIKRKLRRQQKNLLTTIKERGPQGKNSPFTIKEESSR